MELGRRALLRGAAATSLVGLLGLAGCSDSDEDSSDGTSDSESLTLDSTAWNYDETNDVYYQIGKYYVARPAAEDYETLAVLVPGGYLDGTDNGDGTYTVTVNDSGTVGGFTASTAPMVFPVNTPGYAAQAPLTSYDYDQVSSYLSAGFVYVHAGMRGKDSNTSDYTGNAPWGVTDLKAAVRYVRYNADQIPGSKDRIVCFGHSGGGAQSAIMGASGDSALYEPYLESLGAAMTDAQGETISDAIAGAMCWCPITGLDYANASYEWNMGQFSSTDTRADGTWTRQYSTNLAEAWADYQNALRLTDSSGTTLALEPSGTGVYLAGSYYDHMVSVLNESLNNFLADTTFPYTPSNASSPGMDSGGGAPDGGDMPSGDAMPSGGSDAGAPGGDAPGESATESTTYQTVQEYIAYLNSTGEWVTYDAGSNTATVASLGGFVTSQKSPSKSVGAFDGPDRSMTENVVFGDGTDGLHFAQVSRDVVAANEDAYAELSGWTSDYASAEYDQDFAETDSVGKDIAYRSNMYNPMYYLSDHYEGYQSATVAPHWRIRTGITQGDTASTTEVNLALALQNLGVGDVDFATVWGQGHTQAERTGDATSNFIGWVKTNVAG